MATRPPWMPSSELVAAALASSGGTITIPDHGRLNKIGRLGAWDMSQEWVGHPLTSWSVVKSNWTQGWTVRFRAHLLIGDTPGTFALDLDGATPREEAEQIAQTYMTILNLRRKE